MLNAWHGLPPMTTSTLPSYSVQSTPATSPKLGTSGNRFASRSQQNGSISEKATGFQPREAQATEAASMPLKRLM